MEVSDAMFFIAMINTSSLTGEGRKCNFVTEREIGLIIVSKLER